jgi:hypothetical protein
MANMRVFKPSFGGGELSPEMFGRIDDAKFQNGAASIQNFITTPLGPAEKRPGFEYVNTTKNNGAARLIPFVYSATQTMVVEMGAGYFRFHTNGETLLAGTPNAFVLPSTVTLSNIIPCVVTLPNHGLTAGDLVAFSVSTGGALPTGITAGTPYYPSVIDANTFNIKATPGGTLIATSGSSSGTISVTSYAHLGNCPVTLTIAAPCAISGNILSVDALMLSVSSGGTLPTGINAASLYYVLPITWHGLLIGCSLSLTPNGAPVNTSGTQSGTITAQRYSMKAPAVVTLTTSPAAVVTWPSHSLSTGNTVAFEVSAGGTLPTGITADTPYFITVIDANTFSISATSGGALVGIGGTTSGTITGIRYYNVGELVTFQGTVYYAASVSISVIPGGSSAWYALPSTALEVPTPYAASDLFGIHYVQSNDILTVVHPNYPPMELRRLGATQWALVPIVFGPALAAPAGVAITASPGYLCQIASIVDGTDTGGDEAAIITTVAAHTLATGDGIYIENLTATISGQPTVLDGFYLVNDVPVNSNGTLKEHILSVMDYSGNILQCTSWTAHTAATIQYGSKIFNIINNYVVTAVLSDGIQQSAISAEVSVLNNLNVTGSFNTITWSAVPGAYRYYIYKMLNGLYGYIGETTPDTLTFNDNNIAPDMSTTPTLSDPVFNSAGNYPGAVSYYQQRRCFGGTLNQPANFWMTKSGTESDMSYSLPVEDSDRVAIGIAVREMTIIQHIVPLLQLLLLSSSSELSVSPINTDVITPSTIDARPQSYIGASDVQPTIINNSLVYCANRGGHVREMGYQWQIGGYVTGDVSLRAAHLFDNLTIADQAFMKCPWQVVWFVSSNGGLLGLTYIPEEGVGAWHHHVTAGSFLSTTCVAEGAEDRLYAIIQRTVNGATVNYIERMRPRNFGTIENAFFVDAGATFDGTNTTATTVYVVLADPVNGIYSVTSSAPIFAYPATTDLGSVVVLTGPDGTEYRLTITSESSTAAASALADNPIPANVLSSPTTTWAWARSTINGLTWLEGQTVSILADGCVQPQRTVTSGSVSIQRPSVLVTIGIPYTSQIDTLPLVLQIDGNGQGRMKNINKAWVRVQASSSIFAGPSPNNLVQYKQRTTEGYGSPPNLVTDEVEILLPASWQSSGQIYVQHTDPLPLTVVGLTLEAAIGG